MKTIKNKIAVVILGIVTAVAIILGILSYVVTQSSTRMAVENNLIETAKIAAMAAQNSIATYTYSVSEMATNPILADETVPISEKQTYLDGKVAAYYMRSAGYIDTSGTDLSAGGNVMNEEYFVAAMKGNTYMSAPYITEDKKDMYIVISAPVKNGEQITAVVYFVCDTSILSSIVVGTSVGNLGTAYILDKYGRTIAYSDPALVLNSENIIESAKTNPNDTYLAELAVVEQKMISGKAGIDQYSDHGEPCIQSYAPIPGSDGWSIAITANLDEFMQPANIAAIMQTLATLLLCILAFFIAKKIGKSIAAPITACAARLKLMAQGDLHTPVPQSSAKDERRTLINGLDVAVTTLGRYVEDIDHSMGEMAKSNFDFNSSEQYIGDFQSIETSIVAFRTTISSVLKQIKQSAQQVSTDSNQVSSGAQSLAQSATEQANSVVELSAEMVDISEQIKQTSENTTNLKQLACVVGSEVTASGEQMTEMVVAISEIRKASERIGKIIKTIEDIAFQTNILALNASVEAARAGAAGKGFSVVADEVRNLASKSSSAAKQTNTLIDASVQSVANGVGLADRTAASLAKVVTGTAQMTTLIAQIADASTQQSQSIAHVKAGVEQINASIQINSATSEESAAASVELNSQADKMETLVSKFQLKDD